MFFELGTVSLDRIVGYRAWRLLASCRHFRTSNMLRAISLNPAAVQVDSPGRFTGHGLNSPFQLDRRIPRVMTADSNQEGSTLLLSESPIVPHEPSAATAQNASHYFTDRLVDRVVDVACEPSYEGARPVHVGWNPRSDLSLRLQVRSGIANSSTLQDVLTGRRGARASAHYADERSPHVTWPIESIVQDFLPDRNRFKLKSAQPNNRDSGFNDVMG
jgi:hypothetical protein